MKKMNIDITTSNGNNLTNASVYSEDIVTENTMNRKFYEEEKFFTDFTVHQTKHLEISYNHQNLVKSVSNRLMADVLESFRSKNQNDSEIESKVSAALSNSGIYPTNNDFVKTEFAGTFFEESIRYVNSLLMNSESPVQEIQRIGERQKSKQLLEEAIEQLENEITTNCSQLSFIDQVRCLRMICEDLNDLTQTLEETQTEITARLTTLRNEQDAARQEETQVEQTEVSEIENEKTGKFVHWGKKNLSKIPLVGKYLSAEWQDDQQQPETFSDSLPVTNNYSALIARFEFKMVINQSESEIYGNLRERLNDAIEKINKLLNNFSQKIGEFWKETAKFESNRDSSPVCGELLLNGQTLTEATISFVSDGVEKEVLKTELKYLISPIIADMDLAVPDSYIERAKNLIEEKVSEKLNAFNITDAVVSLLKTQHTFYNQLYEAIKLTAAVELSSGWQQHLLSKIDYFATISYPQSLFSETNGTFSQTFSRIKESLHLKMQNESYETEKEKIIFYLEYFCLPLEALDIYQQNISAFEKIKDQPIFTPHFDLYED